VGVLHFDLSCSPVTAFGVLMSPGRLIAPSMDGIGDLPDDRDP
jgi:hypothetical protein